MAPISANSLWALNFFFFCAATDFGRHRGPIQNVPAEKCAHTRVEILANILVRRKPRTDCFRQPAASEGFASAELSQVRPKQKFKHVRVHGMLNCCVLILFLTGKSYR